jgi:hypothetical protein
MGWEPGKPSSRVLITRTPNHPMVLRNLRFFLTIATLGTPYDITLQEIRIEYLFPADEVTEYNWSLA